MLFFGNEAGLLLGREMYRTTDGGRTWEEFKTVTWDGQFSFVDPHNLGCIAGSGEQSLLVYTSNGGLTWEEITPRIAP